MAVLGKLAGMIDYHGVSVTVDRLIVTVSTLAQVFGLITVWVGRYRHGNITWYGRTLNPNETELPPQ